MTEENNLDTENPKQKNGPDVILDYSTEIKQAASKWWRRNSNKGGKFEEEDLQQEAALAAIKAASRFDETKGSLGGYIYSSASREAMKYVQENTYDLKVSRNTQENEKIHHGWAIDLDMKVTKPNGFGEDMTLGDLIPASGELPVDKMQRDEEKEALLKGLASLNPIEYDVIKRHKLDGQTIKEISTELGMSTNNLYSIEKKGMEKLKAKLQQLMGLEID